MALTILLASCSWVDLIRATTSSIKVVASQSDQILAKIQHHFGKKIKSLALLEGP